MNWCTDCEVLHPVGDCERIQAQRAQRARNPVAHHDQLSLSEAPDASPGARLIAEHTGNDDWLR